MTRHPLRALWVASLLVSPLALGGAEIRILDGDASGQGLNDRSAAEPVGGNPGKSVGEQRLMAAQYAAALWSATLGNQVAISIQTEFVDLDCSGGTAVLGASGPAALFDDNRYPAALANELAGQDLDTNREEIDARFNARVGRSDCAVTTWYTGLDNLAPSGTTDLPSVFLHEMAHGLGFIKSATSFRDRALDATSGVLLSDLSTTEYDAAIRRPFGVSWVGPAVRAAKDGVLDRTDGLMRLTDGRTFPLARARFGPGHVSLSAPVVLAEDADGGTGHDACGALLPAPGALVVAERALRTDAGLFCFVSERALNAQAAGAVGLVVRPTLSGSGPTSYTGDAGPGLTIPVWGISSDDGAALEEYIAATDGWVSVDSDGRRAGENLAGDVLLYTPSTYSDGSSVGHWDSSASPPLLMMPAINPNLPRSLDLTPAALRDVGWSPPTGLSVGATTFGYDFSDGHPPSFIVQVVNRGTAAATGVVLDAQPDRTLRLVSTAIDCTGGMPCTLGDLAPGAVKTVITAFAFTGSTPRHASVQFRIASGAPAPAARNAATTAVASRASGCSSTGSGPGGALGLLVVSGWMARRRQARSRARDPKGARLRLAVPLGRAQPEEPPMFQPLYTAVATAHGGREGKVQTDDGQVSHALAMPTSLGGKGGPGTNPEQLFAAGYAACFESALRLVARLQKKPLKDATITARVTIGKTDDGGFGLSAELHGHVDGVSTEETRALMEAAHQVCPYSRATRGNIQVTLVAD